MTIRAKLSLSTLITVLLVLAELALVLAMLNNESALNRALQARHDSLQLANELRYSSDELTRTARTYAVTGDPRYRDAYWQILAVRDGRAPRPDGRSVPLRSLLQEVGITAEELGKLQEAEDNSNALVATEVAAFQAMEGRFLPDGAAPSRDASAYTRRGAPDPAFATRIMHDARYHAEKARIMGPIQEYEASVAARTQATVSRLAARGHVLMLCIGALVLALVVVAVGTHLLVHRPVQASVRLVTCELDDLAKGEFQITRRLQSRGADEIAALAAAFNAVLDQLAALVREVREEAAGVVGRAGDMGTQLAQLEGSLEQQEASTHSTNAAAHEIAVTSGELRGSVRAMADTAERTRQVVAEGEVSLTRLSANMEALLFANRQIVGKLSVINEKASQVNAMADIIRRVAEQTDLLSLNAAIEAEKAGEYGRGFGVVAREIRRLADQSEAAIQDIEAVVRDVRGAIGAGVMEMDTFSGRLVDSVTEAQHIQAQLGEMIQDVQRLLPMLQELDASFRGQDEGVQQIRADMQQLGERVKATVETLAAAQANRLRVEDAGRRLRALVEQLVAMA